MTSGTTHRPAATSTRMMFARVALAAPLLAGVAAACGDSSSPRPLSAEAQEGQAVARRAGCAGCHGDANGGATVGPSWVGLWGTDVTLDDGRLVRADAVLVPPRPPRRSLHSGDNEFVRTAVRDPDAQRPEGTWLHMPTFGERQVSEADLEALIAYIRELGPSS